MTDAEVRALFQKTCSKCGHEGNNVKKRYSFGVYAGRLCTECCSTYADNCGEEYDLKDLDEYPDHY